MLAQRDRQTSIWKEYVFSPITGVVHTTPMDRALGRSVKIKAEDARGELNSQQQEFSRLRVFRDLLADTFFTYYLNDPELREPADLPPEYRISQMLLRWMATQPDSLAAKSLTTSSAPGSVAAALFSWRAMLSDEAFQAIRDALQRLANMRSEIEKQRQDEEGEQDQQSQPQQGGEQEQGDNGQGSGQDEEQDEEQDDEQGGGQDEEQGDDEQDDGQGDEQDDGQQQQTRPQPSKADLMEKDYEQKAAQVERAVERMMNNPVTNGAMRATTKESRKKIENLDAMAKAWGLDMGSMSVLDVTAIMDLYENNRDFIDGLSQMIGRSETASRSALQRVRESYVGNPTKINLTKDLTKVLPFESILLSDMAPHVMRTQQVLNWVDQGLLGWVIEAEGEVQGSFVAYVDGSYSMEGDRIMVAKAIAFGLAKTLHEDRQEQRAYVIKTFGTENDGFIEIDERSDMNEVAKWAGEYFAGGTEFDYCFEDCLIVMEELEERDVIGADLVFITDGEAQLSDEHAEKWEELSERTGSRMLLVVVRDKARRFVRANVIERVADLILKVDTQEFANNPEKVIDQLMNVVAIPRKDVGNGQ